MSDDSKKHNFDLEKFEKKDSKNNDSFRVTKDIDPFRHIRASTDALAKSAAHQRLSSANLVGIGKLILPHESPAFRLMKEMEERKKCLFFSIGENACRPVEKAFIESCHSFHGKINEIALSLRKSALTTPNLVGRSFRSLHDSFSHLRNHNIIAKVNSALDPIVDMNKRLQESFGFINTVVRRLQEDENRRKTLLGLSPQIFSTGKKLDLLYYNNIGESTGVSRYTFTAQQKSINETLCFHDNLVDSFDELREFSKFPDFVRPKGTSEIHVNPLTISSLQYLDEDVELDKIPLREDDKCVELLADYSPMLVQMYKGAIESFLGDNPDWKRHTLTSLRELCRVVIQLLGPDEQVNYWIDRQPSRKPYVGENDKPTRYAKLKYISRDIKNHDLAEYFDKSFSYFNKLYNILSRIHELDISFSSIEMCAIIIEVESKLKLLLTIGKMNSHSLCL